MKKRSKRPARGETFLTEVREWLGTPFHPQQASKGYGCDCKGLLWGAAREIGFPEADTPYAQFIAYDLGKQGGIPSELLKEGMAALFDRVEDLQTGDLLLLKSGATVGHLAVYSGECRVIHAQIRSKAWVKETRLAALLHFCPLDSVWRWRDG